MFSVFERIMSFESKPSTAPKLSIYEQRIKCFETLIQLQKNIQSTDEEYLTVSIIEGKTHENAWKRIESFTKEYQKEYELCEKIMKY